MTDSSSGDFTGSKAFDQFKSFLENAQAFVVISPEDFTRVARAGADMYFNFLRTFSSTAGQIQEKATKEIQEGKDLWGLFKIWESIYRDTIGKMVKIPPVGITREASEKFLRGHSASVEFQAALFDLNLILSRPILESLEVLTQEIAASGEEKEPKSFEDLEKMWIKTAEDKFQQLLRSPEFSQQLAKTVNAGMEFWSRYRELMEEYLRTVPVATSTDLDEVHRELHNLRMQVADLKERIRVLQDSEE